MKIIVIGASGTVGRAVAEELSRQHEVIRVGRTHGDEQVDITSQHSVAGAVRENWSSRCHCLSSRQLILWPAKHDDRPRF